MGRVALVPLEGNGVASTVGLQEAKQQRRVIRDESSLLRVVIVQERLLQRITHESELESGENLLRANLEQGARVPDVIGALNVNILSSWGLNVGGGNLFFELFQEDRTKWRMLRRQFLGASQEYWK
ncbi:hypothetical protein NL676_026019 [Syzygium grande]|nr:hypothetical protein NL676_026019 [Syzygium grande]